MLYFKKNMLKYLSVGLIALMVCLSLGCEKDDEESKDSGWTFKNESSYAVTLIWRFSMINGAPSSDAIIAPNSKKFIKHYSSASSTIYWDYSPKDQVLDNVVSEVLIIFVNR